MKRNIDLLHGNILTSLTEAVEYGKGAAQLAIAMALSFAVLANVFAWQLVGFFHLNTASIVANAVIYLRIACGMLVFSHLGQTMTGLYTAVGNSRTPFLANGVGLALNMILDPMLILGLGPFPRLGVAGAAIARQLRIWKPTSRRHFKSIVRIGFPTAIQDMIYCSISMYLTRFVTSWGDAAVAVQRVGGQIEAISWMTAEGFGTAINAFTGQNYGAGNLKRVKKGYTTAAGLMFVWGIFTSLLLIFGATPIFSIFIHEPEVIPAGASYLRILGVCEMFMCIELMTVGAMSGLGRTMEASVITIILTALRIPMAIVLGTTALGLDGVWWALTISSIIKGIVFFIYYQRIMRRWNVR